MQQTELLDFLMRGQQIALHTVGNELEGAPAGLTRLHTLLLAGGSMREGEVRKQALEFAPAVVESADEARDRLRSRNPEAARLVPGNLPGQGTSFVGRELELSEVTKLLMQPECRLLSVVGPGGVGKTRLALQTA